MIQFFLISISVLSALYLKRMLKYKFDSEERVRLRVWQKLMYSIIFIPSIFLGVSVLLIGGISSLLTIIFYLIIFLCYRLYVKNKETTEK